MAPINSSSVSVAQGYAVNPTAEDVKRVSEQADNLFSTLLVQEEGKWVVNYQEVAKQGVDSAEIKDLASALNEASAAFPDADADVIAQPGASRSGMMHSMHSVKSPKYAKCVLNATGFGTLFGATSAGGKPLVYLLAAKNWREAAWVIFKLAGKSAVKGGVAGLAASLVAAGAWCATPWAS